MSWTQGLAAGIATHLATNGVAAWSPTDPYTAEQEAAGPCIFTGALPDEPEQAIAIKVRPLAPASGLTQVGIQVVVRDPHDLASTTQAVVDALHDAHDLTLTTADTGTYRLPTVWLQSWGDDLTDQAGAPIVSLNFYSWARFTGLGSRD